MCDSASILDLYLSEDIGGTSGIGSISWELLRVLVIIRIKSRRLCSQNHKNAAIYDELSKLDIKYYNYSK